jgi:glycosyltransferase involved in cell wall biosynthesis
VISVVIPVRNGGNLLAEQLEALTAQTFTGPWELIIADNGSTDGTAQAVRAWADRLPIRLVDASDRMGPAHARNVGARSAVSAVVAYIDADDVVDPEWLHEIVEAADADALVGGAYDPTTLNSPAVLQARGRTARAIDLDEGPAGFLPFSGSANFAIGRELLLGLGGWDESMRHCEDVELCWRAQLAGHPLRFCPTAVVHYRYRTGLRPLVSQMINYASAEAELYRRYARRGAIRRGWSAAAGRYWWLVSRSPYLLLGERRRTVWVAVLGTQVGRMLGSVRSRVWYL